MSTVSLVIAIAAAFVIAVVITKYEIPVLREKAGQNIREEGLKSHYSKAGTPSMGGISFIIATFVVSIAATLILGGDIVTMLLILLVFLGFGLIGFFDDYLKVIKKHNEGLKAKQKFALQMVISIIFAIAFAQVSDFGTSLYIPVADIMVNLGFFYYVFIVFAVLAMTNAVNLTDGLDGLASGVTILVSLFFTIAGVVVAGKMFPHAITESYFFASLCGGCLGFLVFNKNPAKVFMGDTGSLALGGGLAAAAIAMKLELLLVVAGLLYVIEALSVVMQVSYFKATHGKRIFKMAPIHHHFEMCGWTEKQVVARFWTFTLICCIVAMFMI